MTEFFEKHSTHVLINRNQHEVFLDNPEDPGEMWSTTIFHVGQTVTVDGGFDFKISAHQRIGMGVHKFKLTRELYRGAK